MVQHAATVVMVHGAWHGPWCFERVVPLLRDADVDARAVALAGEGYESDVASVRDALDGIAGDVVLLGHSYGGAVITEAGVHPAVRHLVYLCAFALDEGESSREPRSTSPTRCRSRTWAAPTSGRRW